MSVWSRFWAWYERHYLLNVGIAAVLFVLQLLHLLWLALDPIAIRLFETSFWNPSDPLQWGILVVDYTEIPVLVSVSLVYLNELRKGFSWKPLMFLLFLNSQWLHIFWITDEFVVNEFNGTATVSSLPAWAAWIAILIDYLEVPVIIDTLKRFTVALRERRVKDAFTTLREEGVEA